MSSLNPLPGLLANRYLLGQLIRREVLAKYRGSVLGIGWSVLNPLLLLFAFTVVFGGIFGGRWSPAGEKTGLDMAIFIYCGLAVFVPFAEVISQAPRLLLANQHYVRKVVFPTHILPFATVMAASVHGAVHVGLLLLAVQVHGGLPATALLVPLVLLPAWLLTLGLAWLLAAVGAYVRDLAHAIPALAQLLMFMLPVFYPNTSAPSFLQAVNSVNPLSQAMEDVRRTLLTGATPAWDRWIVMLALSTACALLGHLVFDRCREEFADVL